MLLLGQWFLKFALTPDEPEIRYQVLVVQSISVNTWLFSYPSVALESDWEYIFIPSTWFQYGRDFSRLETLSDTEYTGSAVSNNNHRIITKQLLASAITIIASVSVIDVESIATRCLHYDSTILCLHDTHTYM